MKRTALYIAILLFLSVDCRQAFEVTEHAGEMSFERAEAVLVGEELTIVNVGGSKQKGTIVAISPQALTYRPKYTDSTVSMPLDSIYRLEEGSSFGRTMGLGFASCGAGCLLGNAIGNGTAPPEEPRDAFDCAPSNRDAHVIGATMIGGTVGFAVGTIVGGTSTAAVYTFPKDSIRADSLFNDIP